MELSIDNRLIFAILNGKVSTAINHRLVSDFRTDGIDLTPEQWTVLLYLSERDGVSQQQLCEATYTGKPSMTRLIDAMERNGIVRREKTTADRRKNLIRLTPKGHQLRTKAGKTAGHTLKEALRGLGQESLIISQEVLRRIFENTSSGTKDARPTNL